ncbi:MAG: hypothetical protein H0U59_01990, partial [Gemmatimonadaceae bacterium]|nr:hypothetical protein [Gemmatimonadaceae bacterium]
MTLATFISLTIPSAAGATSKGGDARGGDTSTHRVTGPVCVSARRGLAFYRIRRASWLELRGISTKVKLSIPRGCAHVLWQAKRAREKSHAARLAFYEWLEKRKERRTWDVSYAINYVFGPYASQAHRVVSCESGHSTTAQNGQYLGLFQMGS